MKEYDRNRRAVRRVLKEYTGWREGKPVLLPRSRRVLNTLTDLSSQSGSVHRALPHSNRDHVFVPVATSEDFRERMRDRMIVQIIRYLNFKPHELTKEWKNFGRRHRETILQIQSVPKTSIITKVVEFNSTPRVLETSF